MTACWFRQLGDCDGRIQRAHLIPKQRLKRAGVRADDDVWDQRVVVPACARHHTLFDMKFIHLEETDYPETLQQYAGEHGFAWQDAERGWVHHGG